VAHQQAAGLCGDFPAFSASRPTFGVNGAGSIWSNSGIGQRTRFLIVPRTMRLRYSKARSSLPTETSKSRSSCGRESEKDRHSMISSPNIESHIVGSQKLIEIYGQWPSFHDAEVIELHFSRGDIEAYISPALTAKIHIFIERPSSQHTLARLKFDAVENFQMESFNHQNAIFDLLISIEDRTLESGENLPPYLVVEFRSAFGMSASFRCLGVKVIEATRCDERGKPCG
jgi:hypothetical protein